MENLIRPLVPGLNVSTAFFGNIIITTVSIDSQFPKKSVSTASAIQRCQKTVDFQPLTDGNFTTTF